MRGYKTMMTINGKQISFDMDVRADYAKFVKSHAILQKKRANTRGSFDDQDMENFLRGCINKDEIQQLLEDNRISTLAKVFAEFFNQAVDQLDAVLQTYSETADIIVDTNAKLDSLNIDMENLKRTFPDENMEATNVTETSGVASNNI